MNLKLITHNLRRNLVFLPMKILTPKLCVDVRKMCSDREKVNICPRPMIKHIAECGGNNLIGAEVGVSAGVNGESICKVLDIKRLYLIDPYLPYCEGGITLLTHVALKNMAVSRLNGKPVVWCFMSSLVASKLVEEPLDFVYIDAAHDYENVKADIEAWFPLVKSGGIIGGHDFIFNCEGVINAVLEFVCDKGLKLSRCFPDWWVTKKS